MPRSSRRGSVRPYRDGFRAKVSLGTDATGKRHQPTKFFRTQREGERWVARMLADYDAGLLVAPVPSDQVPTLAAWWETWITEHVSRTHAASTVAAYRRCGHRVLAALGAQRLTDISAAMVRAHVAQLAEEPRRDRRSDQTISGATQRRHYAALSACLQAAVYNGLIPTNPCVGAKPPAETSPTAGFLDQQQLAQVLKALTNEPLWFQAAVYLAVGCGLRRGEIVALEWADIDWTQRVLYVRRSTECLAGQPQTTKAPKSATGNRAVPIPPQTLEALRAWQRNRKRRQAVRVFTVHGYRWLRADSLSRHWWGFAKRQGLAVTFHGLRHTAASHMLGNGVPTVTVAALLGHSSAVVTQKVYAHVLGASQQHAAQVMAQALGGADEARNEAPGLSHGPVGSEPGDS